MRRVLPVLSVVLLVAGMLPAHAQPRGRRVAIPTPVRSGASTPVITPEISYGTIVARAWRQSGSAEGPRPVRSATSPRSPHVSPRIGAWRNLRSIDPRTLMRGGG